MSDDDELLREKVLGLDPRVLLARAAAPFDMSAILRAWVPPSLVEMAALFPELEVLEMIGRGGMGAVYRARQRTLDRQTAIKLLPSEAVADVAFAERFRTEARALARMQHPNIVTAYDSGQTPAGHLFILMEFVDGTDLAKLIATGPVASARAIEIACAVCAALEFAHVRGIVHRDIKPANVLLATDGRVKVADFGLARMRAAPELDESRLTIAGSVLGTPDYMAPEQRAGAAVDHRADLYSVGVMLYEMLTGELPRGAWEAASRKVRSDARLDALIRKTLQADPANRFQTAAELHARLTQIQSSAHAARRWLLSAAAFVALLIGAFAWRASVGKPLDSSPRSTATPAAAPLDPLAALDLTKEVVFGEWHWLEGQPGGTLALEHNEEGGAKRVRLPMQPHGHGYDLSFRLVLNDERADCGVILCVGKARTGLLLNVHKSSGLGLVKGQQWDENETLVRQPLPLKRSLLMEIAVRPAKERASIQVMVDGAPLIRWEGPESDLSLLEKPPFGWSLQDAESLGFASFNGAILLRDVRARLLP